MPIAVDRPRPATEANVICTASKSMPSHFVWYSFLWGLAHHKDSDDGKLATGFGGKPPPVPLELGPAGVDDHQHVANEDGEELELAELLQHVLDGSGRERVDDPRAFFLQWGRVRKKILGGKGANWFVQRMLINALGEVSLPGLE
jgi:hypothetical protein